MNNDDEMLIQGVTKQMLVMKMKTALVVVVAGVLGVGIAVGMANRHTHTPVSSTSSMKSSLMSRRYAFYYFKDVICERNPRNRVRMSIDRSKDGSEHYSFTDLRDNTQFRDGAAISKEMSSLIIDRIKLPPGARYRKLPQALFTKLPSESYIIYKDKNKVDSLITEMVNWRSFLARCPVIIDASDIQPTSTARQEKRYVPVINSQALRYDTVYYIKQSFTQSGARKMELFTTKHHADIMGIVFEDRIISAPTIEGVIKGNGELFSGAINLAEAKSMAYVMNRIALQSHK